MICDVLARAFTLLEAVVSVMIFGLLMVAVGSVWTVCWRATERIANRDTQDARMSLVLRRFEKAVEGAVFHKEPKSLYAWKSSEGRVAFSESDRVSFVTSLAPDANAESAEWGALERIRVGLRDDKGGKKQLIAQAAPFTMKEDDWQRETVLLENVAAFRVRFWDGERKDWAGSWSSEERPPVAVQFVIELVGETRSSSDVWQSAVTARVFPSMDPSQTVASGTTVTNLTQREVKIVN
jgi:type II secretory pathway component PulJ